MESPIGNIPEFTVAEISHAVKRSVEERFECIRVRGEVSSVSLPRSGHIYLSFKQDQHSLDAVIWRHTAQRIRTPPVLGTEYLATGKLTAYSGHSKYQLVIDRIEIAGKGALLAMLEERKAKLLAEGLFRPEAKQPIPHIPSVVGVVTSPSGAVIRDILHRLRDRFPRHVLVWPVAVQGENCGNEVAAAIEGFNALAPGGPIPKPNLIIVARGGGSPEDLLGFSDEIAVRTAFASAIPLISAVGHETDTPLIDLAADVRAPTPTAAAELAVPVRADLLVQVAGLEARRLNGLRRLVGAKRQRTEDLCRSLPQPDELLALPSQRLDDLSKRLPLVLNSTIQRMRIRLSEVAAMLRMPEIIRESDRRLERASSDLKNAIRIFADRRRTKLTLVGNRLDLDLVERSIEHGVDGFRYVSEGFSRTIARQVAAWRNRLDATGRLHRSLGYRQTLERGFAVVRISQRVAMSKKSAQTAAELEIEFHDGRLRLLRDPSNGTREN